MDNECNLIFDKLSQVSPISIEIVDIRNGSLLCPSAWGANYLGYSKEEYRVMSRNFFEKVVHPEDRRKQLEAFNYLFNNPHIAFKEFSLRVLKKDGSYGHIQLRLTALEFGEDQKPSTVLAIVTDIEETVKLREKLDDQVRKLAVISFKNSHELRGPVATLLGLLHLIELDHVDGILSRELFVDFLKKTLIKLDNVIHEINQQTY